MFNKAAGALQDAAAEQIKQDHLWGATTTILEAPTGAGKTRILSLGIQNQREQAAKQLVLHSSLDLVNDNAKALTKWTGLTDQSKTLEGNADYSGNSIFAIVNTLASNLDSLPKIDHLHIDELHHATADPKSKALYAKIIDRLVALNPDLKVTGYSATPIPPETKSLHPVFDGAPKHTIAFSDLIAAGQILEPRSVKRNISRKNGFTTRTIINDHYKDAAERKTPDGLNKKLTALRPDNFHEIVVNNWLNEARDKKTLFYAETIESADKITGLLKTAGVNAESVHSKDPQASANIQNYHDNNLDVLVSVDMITEGFDNPASEHAINTKETLSYIELQQMTGRVMRADPNNPSKAPTFEDYGAALYMHGPVEAAMPIQSYRAKEREKLKDERITEKGLYLPHRSPKGHYNPWRHVKGGKIKDRPVFAINYGKGIVYAKLEDKKHYRMFIAQPDKKSGNRLQLKPLTQFKDVNLPGARADATAMLTIERELMRDHQKTITSMETREPPETRSSILPNDKGRYTDHMLATYWTNGHNKSLNEQHQHLKNTEQAEPIMQRMHAQQQQTVSR